MAIYMVTYDLIKNKDYRRIIDELKQFEAQKILLSAWLVEVNDSNTLGVFNHFKDFVDDDDRIVVAAINPKALKAKGLQGTNSWITART